MRHSKENGRAVAPVLGLAVLCLSPAVHWHFALLSFALPRRGPALGTWHFAIPLPPSPREQPNRQLAMSDSFSDSLDPEAGFTTKPTSVSQAAADLRDAAGTFREAAADKAREIAQDAGSQAKAVGHRAAETAHHLKETAVEKAQAIKQAATERAQVLRETAQQRAAQIRHVADEQWVQTRDKARELHVSAEDYIRQHPTKCVLGALGIGFLIGLMSRR